MQEIMIQRPSFDLPLGPFEKFKEIKIHSNGDSAYVTDRCLEITQHIKAIEDQRKKYTAPLDQIKKEMIADERKITEPLKMILQILRRKVKVWLESQEDIRKREAEAKRKAEIKRLEEEKARNLALAMKADDKKAVENVQEITKNLDRLETKPVTYSKASKGAEGVSALTTHWVAEIIDPEAIPREFLLVDEKKLNKLARSLKEKAKVPGVRFKAVTGLVQSK